MTTKKSKLTIECCDSWCKIDGMPTYSELLEALKKTLAICKSYIHSEFDGTSMVDGMLEELKPMEKVIQKAEGDL